MLLRLLLVLAAIVAGSTPACAEWHRAKTRHFIIYADADANDLRAYATKLERFDQAVRSAREMDDPPLTDAGRLTIYVSKNVAALDRVLDTGRSLYGAYFTRASGSYAFVARTKPESKSDLNSDIIFFHEYAHHLMLQSSATSYPPWLVEGFAEFLSTAVIGEDGGVTLGSAANHRSLGVFGINHDLTLSAMVGNTRRHLNAWQEELVYGRGWLLTHYLTFEPSRKGQLDRYLAGIRSGQAPLDSAKAAFGDLRELDRELDRYASRKTLSAIVVQTDASKIGPIQIQSLTAGEAAIMPVRMQSHFGVNNVTAPQVAAQARRIARRFPDDAAVQASLAEAEHDARNFAASIAAADRALAANPSSTDALIYKGRALMRLAKDDPTAADWNGIRSWFARANRLDSEDPEPLMLFYKTYGEAGTIPTANAVKGLLYALVLAPQDDELRIMAVRQLLIDRRVFEAREAFAPLAFNPHAGKFRDSAQEILAAIDASDAAKAIALIDAWSSETDED